MASDLRKVRVNGVIPTKKQIVYSELGEMMDQIVSISKNFYSKFVREPRQEKLHSIIHDHELEPGEIQTILAYGPTGTGKTGGILAEVMDILFENPGMKALFVRNTYVEIEDQMWISTTEFLDKYEVPYTARKGSYEITLGNGSSIRMRSASPSGNSKSNKVHGLGGTEYGIAYLGEVDEIHEEFIFTVYSRLRQVIKGWTIPRVFLDCNPPSDSHWLYEFFFLDEENNPNDPRSTKRVLKFEPGDNTQNVRVGYASGLDKILKDDPLLHGAFVSGEFTPDRKGNPIFYQSFKSDLHVAPTSIYKSWDPDKPIFVSLDFGYNHPAFLVGQDYPELDQVRCYNSWTGKKVMLRPFFIRHMNWVHKNFPGAKIQVFCDPHGADHDNQGRTEETAVDILKDMGYPPRFRRLSTLRGLDYIQNALMTQHPSKYGPQPGILIDPQCSLLIKALSLGYCNDKKAPGGVIKPVKDGVNDHQVDILRYAMIMLRRRGGSKGQKLEESTDNGNWRTVASGAEGDWSSQVRKHMESRHKFIPQGNGRRTFDRMSPNMNQASLW